MKYNKADESIRERLLVAGIKELENHGFNDFSLRRVANICNVSCAAPYKHFKNKEELLLALMEYIISRWHMLRDQVLMIYKAEPPAKKLTEVCTAFLRFLLATPSYITILTLHPDEKGVSNGIRARISEPISALVNEILSEDPSYKELRALTIYSIRSYIYGTVCMIRNHETEGSEDTVAMFRHIIGRIIESSVSKAKIISEEGEETK